MKLFKYFFICMLALLGFTSCETYGDVEIDYTPIHPLGGQYMVNITKDGAEVAHTYVIVANTTEYDKDKCWIRIGAYNAKDPYIINGKISCKMGDLSFEGTNVTNLAGNVVTSNATFTVSGKVTLNGTTTASGTKADKIEFTYTTTKDPGHTYKVEGYRYTGWPED